MPTDSFEELRPLPWTTTLAAIFGDSTPLPWTTTPGSESSRSFSRNDFAALVQHANLLQQAHNCVGWLRADADPVACAVALYHQLFGLANWVVVADDLNELAIARRARIRHYQPIARLLGLALAS